MKPITKILHYTLIALNGFLALTAFAGGIGLLANLNAPPVEMLQGSPFRNYTVPGLALFVIVGGGGLLSAILMGRRNKFALLFSIAAGIVIMFFEFVEMLVIGSPAGVARTLQIFYFGLGTLIVAVALLRMFLDLLDHPING